ncbi:hypothetical protein RF11_08894 [Thelohanellus kitauei]|uniref:CUE domain-containing protein n=1 Tax=Thelohanellus kitauei TaxID=669202 RepID=A0A0C2MPP6_THEKT|nr:hypothetical protein RF11_08894 [Thelohanellus kitauei]
MNDSYVDAWFNLYKFKSSKITGRIHLIIGCISVCPNLITFFTPQLPYMKYKDRFSDFCWPRTPYECSYHYPDPYICSSADKDENPVKRIEKLFPSLSVDLIQKIYEEKNKNVEETINECVELEKRRSKI